MTGELIDLKTHFKKKRKKENNRKKIAKQGIETFKRNFTFDKNHIKYYYKPLNQIAVFNKKHFIEITYNFYYDETISVSFTEQRILNLECENVNVANMFIEWFIDNIKG